MGGTTAKICVIRDHSPAMASTFEVARRHRFKRGSGLPVRIPAIELLEIGAGGGSIARVDVLGLLKVGPDSAGADPGPACYGLGGDEPTVTDADLLLGYLNPENFLGGRMQLDRPAAEKAVARLGEKLGLGIMETAVGIRRIVDEAMMAATRVHLAERGVDPRRLWLLAFGGAGPVHADAIARALKLSGYLIPPSAGVTSALGFLAAPVAFELARTHVSVLTTDALPALDRVFAELAETGRETLDRAGVPAAAMTFTAAADLRHRGQGHELTVTLPPDSMENIGLERLREAFFARYVEVYGYAHRHLDLEVMTCRLTASGGAPPLAPAARPAGGEVDSTGSREAYFSGTGRTLPTPVYQRASLPNGATFAGPALIEDVDSTDCDRPRDHRPYRSDRHDQRVARRRVMSASARMLARSAADSPEEPMPSTEIDPITLEVQWQRLLAIADEMDTATIRASFSTIVGESHDFGCALMDNQGSAIAQAQISPPQFCTMLPRTTKLMLEKFPPATLREGDVLITNDPWIGSTHLPDYNVVTPVYFQDTARGVCRHHRSRFGRWRTPRRPRSVRRLYGRHAHPSHQAIQGWSGQH